MMSLDFTSLTSEKTMIFADMCKREKRNVFYIYETHLERGYPFGYPE